MIRNSQYFVLEALINMRRHGVMSLATISTAALALGVFGLFVLLGLNLGHVMLGEAEKLGNISVFLRTDAGIKEAEEVEQRLNRLERMREVKSFRFVHKDVGLRQIQELYGNHMPLRDLAGRNPLPHKFEVEAADALAVSRCAERLRRLPYVDEVACMPELVERLASLIQWSKIGALTLSLLLATSALALIYNAIRLTIYARRQEIRIMQLVGATPWFIKMPFLLEGLTYGAIGSAVAASTLLLGYESLLHYIAKKPALATLVAVQTIPLSWFGMLVLIGSGFGLIGSFLAVRRLVRYE